MSALAAIYKAMLGSSNAPTVQLTTIPGGVRLTVTDISGSKSADILNGTKGDKGDDGDQGEQGPQGRGIASVEKISDVDGTKTYKITMTDEATFTFTVDDGDDGKSVTHSWDGTKLTISSASGTSEAVDLKGEKGDKGDPGEGFHISKVFESVSQMNSGFATDSLPIGAFVLIDTGNVEDEDNAKLYVKSINGYSYLTDLSGSQGIKGDPGTPGDPGPRGAGITDISLVKSDNGVDTYKISYGEDGESFFEITNGSNGKSAYHSWDGTKLTITSAGGTSTADLKGEKGDKGDDGVLTPEQEELLAVIPDLKDWYDKNHHQNMTGDFTPEYSSKTVDIGTTIKETFTWDFSKELKELYINKVLQESKLQKGDTGELTIQCLNSEGNHTDGTKEISIKGVHAGPYGDENAYKIWTFNFRNKLYYGARAGETIDEAGVKELSKSAYATNYKNTGFNLNDSSSDKYLWYVFPERFEDKKAPVFTVGGFEGSFKKVATIQDFANDELFEEPYSVYRSIFPGICDMTVTVS